MPEYNQVTDEIFTVSDLFSPDECRAYVEMAESIGFELATINTVLGPKVKRGVRNNTRVILDDHKIASELWSRITDYIPRHLGEWEAVGVNERLRFYRYDIGQKFEWHRDEPFERRNAEKSHLTFMVYLNDGFSGGETTLQRTNISPQTGLALFFIHSIPHKGQPVDEGRKYVLRTDVMYRRASP